jgi:ADP-heptose:LPS heptosyltransferase
MNITRMRRIDRWIGVPVCFLLTCLRRILPRRTPEAAFRPRRILFVKLAEQGSTVLAHGALRRAAEKVGRENVFFLLFAENRPILDLMDVIPPANVIAINARGLLAAVWGALAAIVRMRRLGIDAAIDLEFFARSSAALCYLSGARWRAGYHAFGGEASYRGDLMTHRVSFNPYLHTSQTFQILVEALDQPAGAFPLFDREPPAVSPARPFRPRAEEVAEVKSVVDGLLESGGVGRPAPSAMGRPRPSPRRLILLNANASDLLPLRRWPSERYVELARRLLARYPDAGIVFTGAPNEAAAAEALVAKVGSERCISMAGRTTLRQLLVLCHLAEVLVTNDSGPAHFASLTPIDVVVLFGPETPRLFAAPSPRTHPLWAGIACSPCINAFNDRFSACRDNVCMQRLSVEHVFQQVARLYEQRRDGLGPILPAAEAA